MKTLLACLIVIVLVSLSNVAPLFAHHGRGAAFDTEKTIEVKGTVSQIAWRNPHVRIFMDVKGPDGKVVTWSFEGAGTTNLAQQGYNRDTLKLGQEITAVTRPARNGVPNGLIVRFVNSTGETVWQGSNNPLD